MMLDTTQMDVTTRALVTLGFIQRCESYALAHKRNFRMLLVNLGHGTEPEWCVSLPPPLLPVTRQLFYHDRDLLTALEQLVAAIENEPPVPLKPGE